jgi:hypothetical protein
LFIYGTQLPYTLTEKSLDRFEFVIKGGWWVGHRQTDIVLGGKVLLRIVVVVQSRQTTAFVGAQGVRPGLVGPVNKTAIKVRTNLIELCKNREGTAIILKSFSSNELVPEEREARIRCSGRSEIAETAFHDHRDHLHRTGDAPWGS